MLGMQSDLHMEYRKNSQRLHFISTMKNSGMLQYNTPPPN